MLRSVSVMILPLGLMICPIVEVEAQLFRRQRPMKRVIVRQQIVTVPQVQTLFLVAPPSYYGVPQYTPPQVAGRRRDHDHAEIVSTLSKVVDTLTSLTARVGALEISVTEPVEPPVVIPPPPSVRLPLIVKETCGKCHGGDQSKGEFSLSELGNPNRLLMSQAMVANTKMPLDADGNVLDLAPHVRSELFAALKKMEPEQ